MFRDEPEMPAMGRVQLRRSTHCCHAVCDQSPSWRGTLAAELWFSVFAACRCELTFVACAAVLHSLLPVAVVVRTFPPRHQSACHGYGGGRTQRQQQQSKERYTWNGQAKANDKKELIVMYLNLNLLLCCERTFVLVSVNACIIFCKIFF